MSALQFMPAGVGFGPIGKNDRTKTNTKNIIETILTGRPARPRLNFDGSSGSPRILFNAMHDMDTMYDAIMAPVESEAMFMRATDDPRLIRERRHDTPNARQIALMGTFHFGGTYSRQCLRSLRSQQK